MNEITVREKRRRKAFPLKRSHAFPSTTARPEWTAVSDEVGTHWILVPLEAQLFRWLRTEAFRALNSRSIPLHEDEALADEYTVEEVSLAYHLLSLVRAEADAESVVEREYLPGLPEGLAPDWADLLSDGFNVRVTEVAPAISRSGIRVTYDRTNKRDEIGGRFGYDQILDKCLRASRFALEAWDPQFTARLSAAGTKGGRTSRRGPKFTVDMLDGLEPWERTDSLTVAKKLGCSYDTAVRLIRKAKEATS